MYSSPLSPQFHAPWSSEHTLQAAGPREVSTLSVRPLGWTGPWHHYVLLAAPPTTSLDHHQHSNSYCYQKYCIYLVWCITAFPGGSWSICPPPLYQLLEWYCALSCSRFSCIIYTGLSFLFFLGVAVSICTLDPLGLDIIGLKKSAMNLLGWWVEYLRFL